MRNFIIKLLDLEPESAWKYRYKKGWQRKPSCHLAEVMPQTCPACFKMTSKVRIYERYSHHHRFPGNICVLSSEKKLCIPIVERPSMREAPWQSIQLHHEHYAYCHSGKSSGTTQPHIQKIGRQQQISKNCPYVNILANPAADTISSDRYHLHRWISFPQQAFIDCIMHSWSCR